MAEWAIRQWVAGLALGGLLTCATPVWAVEISPSFQAGIQAYRHGAYSQALAHLNKAMEENPRDTNIRYYMAVSLDRLNRVDEAATQYRQVVNQGNTDAKVLAYARTRLQALQPGGGASQLIASAAAVTPSVATSSRLKGRVSKVLVPLKENRNALMVDANLHNDGGKRQTNGTFIIDTGATYTSISQEMAENLGLDLAHAETITITTANGRIEVPKVTIDRLVVNGLEAHNVQATVIQVRHGSSFSGLLGLSFLRQFVLTIDPEAGHLIFQQD